MNALTRRRKRSVNGTRIEVLKISPYVGAGGYRELVGYDPEKSPYAVIDLDEYDLLLDYPTLTTLIPRLERVKQAIERSLRIE